VCACVRNISPMEEKVLSYLSKSKDTLIENYSGKSKSHPVKFYLSKSLKVFG
jgi:hypothetical protein